MIMGTEWILPVFNSSRIALFVASSSIAFEKSRLGTTSPFYNHKKMEKTKYIITVNVWRGRRWRSSYIGVLIIIIKRTIRITSWIAVSSKSIHAIIHIIWIHICVFYIDRQSIRIPARFHLHLIFFRSDQIDWGLTVCLWIERNQ